MRSVTFLTRESLRQVHTGWRGHSECETSGEPCRYENRLEQCERGDKELRYLGDSDFPMTKPSPACRDEGVCGAGLMRKNNCMRYR